MKRRDRKTKGPAAAAPLEVKAQYQGAGMGKRMRGWNPPSSGPNKAIVGLQNIRNRARDVSRNDWAGESAVSKWTTNLIGTGIVPRPVSKLPKALRDSLTELWDEWCKQADADGVLDFYGLETLVTRSWLDAGEVFGRLRSRVPDDRLKVPLQVQLVEAEYVPLLDADTWPGLPAGNKIRSGIELNNYGRRVSYWMYKAHPGDAFGLTPNPTDLVRVPAAEVMHVFEPKRPGQLRGVSSLAPVMTRLRDIGDYDDAVLTRQKIANLFTIFIKNNGLGLDDPTVNPMTGAAYERTSDDSPIATLQPGMSQELEPGQDVSFANPPEAGTTYSDYMRTQHLGTAAGAGLPYELFSGDILNVSDRTLRVLVNEFRRFAKQRQWQIIIPMFCAKVRDAWAERAYAAGSISVTELPDAKRVEWSPHGWEYIHPVQDVTGKALEVENGFRSRSSVIGERGDDPETVDAERAADKKRSDDLGLTVVPNADPSSANTDVTAPAAKPAAKPTKTSAISPVERAQIGLFHAQTTAALRDPVAPVFNMAAPTINVAAPSTTIENRIEPTPVTVAAPNVTVESPSVTVQNTVEPTPVTVNNDVVNNIEAKSGEVTVNLPNRKTESEITRSVKGQITHVTQTETTIPEDKKD